MGVCQSSASVHQGAISQKARGKKGQKGVIYAQSRTFLTHMNELPQGKHVIAEYVWIDGQAMQKAELQSAGLRSK